MNTGTVTIRVERFLTRELQFCTQCYAQHKGWVRVANVADMVELRKGRNEQAARDAYRARRRRAVVRHYSQEHPEVRLGRDRTYQEIFGANG